MMASILVFNKVANVGSCEVAVETKLHVFDFFRSKGIVIIEGRVVDELFIQHSFQEQLEVAHEASVVAVFVFAENRKQAVIALLTNRVLFGLLAEVEVEFDE